MDLVDEACRVAAKCARAQAAQWDTAGSSAASDEIAVELRRIADLYDEGDMLSAALAYWTVDQMTRRLMVDLGLCET